MRVGERMKRVGVLARRLGREQATFARPKSGKLFLRHLRKCLLRIYTGYSDKYRRKYSLTIITIKAPELIEFVCLFWFPIKNNKSFSLFGQSSVKLNPLLIWLTKRFSLNWQLVTFVYLFTVTSPSHSTV